MRHHPNVIFQRHRNLPLHTLKPSVKIGISSLTTEMTVVAKRFKTPSCVVAWLRTILTGPGGLHDCGHRLDVHGASKYRLATSKRLVIAQGFMRGVAPGHPGRPQRAPHDFCS